MTTRGIALIGDGKLAADCMAVVRSRPELSLVAYVFHPHSAWSERNRAQAAGSEVLPCVDANEVGVVDFLRSRPPDLIVNANSFDILREDLRSIPRDGAINFHNGPLPQYRGMNIPTWAIYNGETEHGVAWHFADEGIDTGDIVADVRFPIADDETALSLTFKCLAAGLELFQTLMARYSETGRLTGKPQSGKARCYLARDLPNDSYIDFGWEREQLSRFVRSFSFRPFPNPVLRCRIRVAGRDVYPGDVEVVAEARPDAEPGTVLEADETRIVIATRDARVVAADLATDSGESIQVRSLPIAPGSRIQ